MQAYWGKILHVDLTSQKIWVEHKDEEFYKKYIGGVLMATKLVYDNMPKGVDALSPENALCLATSAFAGTLVPVGNKHGVAAKSPLTGCIGDCLASSYFSASIRHAGYDGIVVVGKAEKPTYLLIDDDDVTLRDASHLWGMETFETEEAIRKELGDEAFRSCTIGPAGERLVRLACITNDRGRQAGRTGLGAVMGSKNLKAITIRGTKSVEVADIDALCEMTLALGKEAQSTKTVKYRTIGTVSNVLTFQRLGILPTRNYQDSVFEGADKISGEYMAANYTEKAVACSGCPIGCEQVVNVKEGPYKGARTSVDYESLYALSSNCGVDYLPGAIEAISRCDRYGMDTMSTGVTVSWAMECFQRGVLTKEDFGGLEPDWGNHEAVAELVRMIAYREGIGDLLAEGTKRAAAKVGKGSDHWAINVKGLECSGHDLRGLKTFAAGASVCPRGPCHNRSLAYEPDTKGKVDRLTADETRGGLIKDTEEYAAVFDIVMLCKFLRGCFNDIYEEIPQLYTFTTGIEMTPDDLRQAAERTVTLKKAFNIREGWKKEDDWLPPRFLKDPIREGASKGSVVKPEELRMMIDTYYEARGWTSEGLIPKQKLVDLGLDDIAEEIGV